MGFSADIRAGTSNPLGLSTSGNPLMLSDPWTALGTQIALIVIQFLGLAPAAQVTNGTGSYR